MKQLNNADVELQTKELVITRIFDAPRELVFKMWAHAEHLVHWWGPKGFEPIVKKLEFKPGGEFHYGMKGANGQELWGKFIYRDIVEPEKIVYVNCFSDADGNITRSPFMPNWPLEILNTITFEFDEGKTKLTIAARPINAPEEEMEVFRTNMGSMQQGFGSIIEKLEEYLATL
jgi:uncharacterized protein YndB with AHSA1/START domain